MLRGLNSEQTSQFAGWDCPKKCPTQEIMRSKFEIRACKELVADGYKVDWKLRGAFPIRGYSIDFFNLFDILAYKEGEPIRWISIKGKSGNYSENRRRIEEFKPNPPVVKEQWRYDRDPNYKSRLRVRKEII